MIRILFLADTHLGFDLPERPRSARRRRGPDFLANYATALAPALAGEVDVVVHGGDVFDRPEVSPSLAWQGLEPLVRVADRGVPVFVVAGNHERSRLPHARFATHPHVYVFGAPRTVVAEVRGVRLAVSGFACARREVRSAFPALVAQTSWRDAAADVRLLCMHQCAEGATVGPGEYVFRNAPDVVRLRDIPAQFDAVLSGHIHRHQVLTSDLRGERLAAPVLYPGSTERTSAAEKDETKGYLQLWCDPRAEQRVRWEFRELPARPMVVREVSVRAGGSGLREAIHAVIGSAPADAVLRIHVRGDLDGVDRTLLSAARLRRVAPPTMTLEVRTDEMAGRPARRTRQTPAAADANLQLDL